MNDFGLLILRVIPAAFMLSAHGWGKLITFSERASTFADPLGVGSALSLSLVVFAEVFCSVLLILGVATRIATIPLIITMLVAALKIHALDPWNKQELPLLFAVVFLAIFFLGAGKYSLGSRFKNKLLRS